MMVDISTVSIMIASAGVFAAAVYYILQIRHQTKIRQTDLVMRLYSTFGSKEFWEEYPKFMTLDFKDFKDFESKYGPLGPTGKWIGTPSWVSYNTHNLFFEGVGVLLHRKLIDIRLVDDLFSIPIKSGWEKVKPIVEGIRKTRNMPSYYEWFEYLYNEMKKREQRLQPVTA